MPGPVERDVDREASLEGIQLAEADFFEGAAGQLALLCADVTDAASIPQALDGELGWVVETYPDRIEGLDEASLGAGPFRGVPFLMKDVFGHERGRKIEFGSRLCRGMVGEVDSFLMTQFRASGVNALGRCAAPEYSMSATTESLMFGNTSNPWKKGCSAGGSSVGAAAAVAAGIAPIAHGSDIGGSIRIPASLCGGVGLKPSRLRVSVGPTVDEAGDALEGQVARAAYFPAALTAGDGIVAAFGMDFSGACDIGSRPGETHQFSLPVSPLKGPARSGVTQPP